MEFRKNIYDFSTEVYFIGKLFEQILREREIEQFKYMAALGRMCQPNPERRTQSFYEIRQALLSEKLDDIEFDEDELYAYREFSQALSSITSKIEKNAAYVDDVDRIQARLETVYKSVMLEEYLSANPLVLRCFVSGNYYFSKHPLFSVPVLKAFLDLLRTCSRAKKNIIVSNIHSKLDAVPRYDEKDEWDGDIPF